MIFPFGVWVYAKYDIFVTNRERRAATANNLKKQD